jgi:hypothetical protein
MKHCSLRAHNGLGVLVVGLGIGTAVAFTPGIASADGLDFQISVDGQDLLPTVGNSATAVSGNGDFAIAWGDGATASANNGIGDFAFADGTNADALSGGGNFDTAIDIGNNTDNVLHFALAAVGNNDCSFIDADNSLATTGGDILDSNITGNNDTALILDPFGAATTQSTSACSVSTVAISILALRFSTTTL